MRTHVKVLRTVRDTRMVVGFCGNRIAELSRTDPPRTAWHVVLAAGRFASRSLFMQTAARCDRMPEGMAIQ